MALRIRATARCSNRSSTVGMPSGRVSDVSPGLGMSTRRTGGAWYCPALSRSRSWTTRTSRSRSNCAHVSPSTPLAPCRFICRQVSARNSGVKMCASDVKRHFGSALALTAILASPVVTLILPLSGGDVSPTRSCALPRRFPMYAAFPRSEYYQRVRLPPQHLPPFGRTIAIGILDPLDQDRGGSPRSLDASFSVRAVLSDPAGVSGILAIADAYCCLPRLQPCR